VTGVQVKSVLAGSVAARAGLSAGDELLAVDGWRIRRLDDARQWLPPEPAPFELLRAPAAPAHPDAAPDPVVADVWTLALGERPAAKALGLRKAWLGR
jgi:membrane-associated protease RseP (regulator of RpoE activity)